MIIKHNDPSYLIGLSRRLRKDLDIELERGTQMDREEISQLNRKIEVLKMKAQIIINERRASRYEEQFDKLSHKR